VEEMESSITKNQDGSYQWLYELSLLKNQSILINFVKILFLITLSMSLMMVIMTMPRGVGLAMKMFLITWGYGLLIMIVLLVLCYLLLSLIMGSKHIVLFKMDEKGVQRIHLEKHYNAAQAHAMLERISEYPAQSLTSAGAGILGATRKSTYTPFKYVKSIKVDPYRYTIVIKERFNKNIIYVDAHDYEYIKNLVIYYCPLDTKVKNVK
jgi:hypothetical protein